MNQIKITKQNILDAVKEIEEGNYGLAPSTKFDVEINGKLYPPKEVMRYAHEQMNGEYNWEFGGGEPTNKFLKKYGFKIHPKSKIMERVEIEEKEDKKVINGKKNIYNNPNIILYGPPGTGKTYSTIEKALEIIGEDINGKNRKEIKEIFEAKMQEGQIVFTTFHQSMCYEDFIEGIKPIEPLKNGEPVIYKIIPGIFKEICNLVKSEENLTNILESEYKNINNFDLLYKAFLNHLKDIILKYDGNNYHTFSSRRSYINVIKINDKNEIVTIGKGANSEETIDINKLKKIYETYKSPEEIKDVLRDLRELCSAGWPTNYYAVFNGLKEFENALKSLQESHINKENKKEDIKQSINKKYVLIIDEINRGNVANIFGELITLIEKDKREGKDEELSCILPYSKEKFSVPSNLYIIGTMNTADRSVEALDTALRRRFDFVEIAPNAELIEQPEELDVDLKELFITINSRIEKLLDKDHCIGHSYFMDIDKKDNPEEELRKVFKNNILPLLQEYFYGDTMKIGMVLGEGFVKQKNSKTEFGKGFRNKDLDGFEDKIIYEISDPMNVELSAFRSIYE